MSGLSGTSNINQTGNTNTTQNATEGGGGNAGGAVAAAGRGGGAQATLDTVYKIAREAHGKAYAPYSKFQVGAAIRGASGGIFSGCNVENASYPVGTCAEEAAIAAMIAAGERVIKEIVIVAGGQNMIVPCGACRQRILEFSTPQTRIYCANLERIIKEFTIEQLLPHAFHPNKGTGGGVAQGGNTPYNYSGGALA
jgi:cytidine deaminase